MVLVMSVRGVLWVPATDTEEAEEEEVEAQLDWGGWMSGRTSAGVVELGSTGHRCRTTLLEVSQEGRLSCSLAVLHNHLG